jgi:hypothetical protein
MSLTSASTDAQVVAQYEDNACYWDSYAKAAAFCEAIIFILNRFPRVNGVGGKSWTREDLTKLLDKAEAARASLEESTGANPKRTMFTRGICKL